MSMEVLEVASLGHALLHIFGPQSDDLARKIAKTLGVQLENNYDARNLDCFVSQGFLSGCVAVDGLMRRN